MDVQGLVWLAESSGTEWGTEALRVKRYVKEGSGKGHLSIGALSGNMEGGSFTGDLGEFLFY
jgi:hypothetical protein